MASKSRSYNDAIDALNSLQTPFAVLEARRKAGAKTGDDESIKKMRTYLARIGYSGHDLDRLNIIHVAGTKGKGSTCAFVDSILSRHRTTRGMPSKVGLLISPHLIAVRERIRINSRPISEEIFARYFFEVWDLLGSAAVGSGAALEELEIRPTYARYLTLMSYHVFLAEKVDVAVYETGIGGEYDSTNVIERPVASGISTLGIDHVLTLGDTVEKIAWHKAGIMKTGSPAFSVRQAPAAEQVLKDRASEKRVELKILDIDPRLAEVGIRPNAQFQKKNASLAVALAETALQKMDPNFHPSSGPLSKEFVDGLEQVVWRGRCEIKVEGNIVWHVDGAHTVDSLKMAGRWFHEESSNKTGPRALIFNQQGRTEAVDFLEGLLDVTKDIYSNSFDYVVFCSNMTFAKTGYKRDFINLAQDPAAISKLTVQRAFAERWTSLDPTANVLVVPSIEEAISSIRTLTEGLVEPNKIQAFITGSLHLVGGALEILEGSDAL